MNDLVLSLAFFGAFNLLGLLGFLVWMAIIWWRDRELLDAEEDDRWWDVR